MGLATPHQLVLPELPVASRQQAQAQGVQLDEAFGVFLVIGAVVIFEGDDVFPVQRIGAGAAGEIGLALVEFQRDFARHPAL